MKFVIKKISTHQDRKTNMRNIWRGTMSPDIVKDIRVVWQEEKQATRICNENIFKKSFEEGFQGETNV